MEQARRKVYLEVGSKRTFAGMLAWPGWSRSGRDEAGALAALISHGQRFGAAMAGVGLLVGEPQSVGEVVVVERLVGGSGTDFGVPSHPPAADAGPLDEDDLERHRQIMRASWAGFDRARAGAAGHALRTGPRGGGRNLERMVTHVMEAEESYLMQLGARPPRPAALAGVERWPGLRERALEALTARAHDLPVPDASRTQHPWTPRYFVRRAAWHVLDHAWEIEDRLLP